MSQRVQCNFDAALSHTRRSDAAEKKQEENSLHTLDQIRLWTIFESSPVSVKIKKSIKVHFRAYSFWSSNFEPCIVVKAEIIENDDHEIIEFNEEDTEVIDTGEAGTSLSFVQTLPIDDKKKPSTKATSSKLISKMKT